MLFIRDLLYVSHELSSFNLSNIRMCVSYQTVFLRASIGLFMFNS